MTNNPDKVYKQIRYLTVYTIISSILLLIFCVINLNNGQKKNVSVEELTAKRINIVEPNGLPFKLVAIFNLHLF